MIALAFQKFYMYIKSSHPHPRFVSESNTDYEDDVLETELIPAFKKSLKFVQFLHNLHLWTF